MIKGYLKPTFYLKKLMAYQVLARKWRPKTFADLVGQEHVVKALRNALDKGRLHHAYLLTGTRGVGKTTIARILAKRLNCESPNEGEPCGQCSACTQIDAGRYVDLLEIDAASNTGIDNIREVLENAQYAPTVGKYKVYIIDEVHMLSKNAFNAMLKTLAHPPEHVKFILATTDPHKVPVTVLSRCLQFVLRNMTIQQIADHLVHVLNSENIPFEAPALQLLGRAAMGSMRDALSLLDQAIAMGSGSVVEQDVRNMIGAVDKRYLYELLQHIINQDGEALMAKAQEMAARAVGFDSALIELATLLQRLALLKTVPGAVDSEDPERETLSRLAQYLSDEQIQLYYQCAIHGKRDLSLAPDEYAGFVMTLLRMLAFAPMAAKNHGLDEVIEGTQLHNPVEGNTAKKPLSLPENVVVPATTFKQPETVVSNAVEHAEPAQTAPTLPEPAADVPPPKANKRSAKKIDTPTADSLPPAMPTQPAAIPHDELPPPWLDTADNSWSNEAELTPQPPVALQPPAKKLQIEQQPQPSKPQADEATTATAADEDFIESLNLPPLSAENWPTIFTALAPKLGAAQMLIQHAAWHSFDESQHLLVLAFKEEARATATKERLDKIQNLLGEIYNLPLKLQSCPWDDSLGLETPVMRRQRLQEQGRQQAQDLLEADPTAQQIVQTFSAEWLPETLELIPPEPNGQAT